MQFNSLAVQVKSQYEADLAQEIAFAYGFKPSQYEWANYKHNAYNGVCFIWILATYIGSGPVTFHQPAANVGSFCNKHIQLTELHQELAAQLGEHTANQQLLAATRMQTTTQEIAAMALKKVSIVRRTVTKDNKVSDKIVHTSEPISNAADNGMLIATAASIAPALKDIPADELFAFIETLPEAK